MLAVALWISPGAVAAASPPNDNYANATLLSGEDLAISGITAEGSLEIGPAGEIEILGRDLNYRPTCFDGTDRQSLKSLWWRWRAPRTGVAFLLQPPYHRPGGICSPTVTVWRAGDLGASFPFTPTTRPLGMLISGEVSPRYLYLPIPAKEGEEFVFQMLGNTPEIYSVRLLMHTGPLILEEPVGRAVQDGESVLLHVVAAGSQRPSNPGPNDVVPGCQYQWWFNDHPLAGETYSTLRIPRISHDRVGTYRVVVSDEHGTNRSRAVELTLRAQPEAPRLEVQIPPNKNPVEFTLYGEPGRIYQLEGSTNLLTWSPMSPQPISGLEVETQYITLGNLSIRDRVAYHGVPFRFHLTDPIGTAFVRARKWESSCDECMSQLWAVQFTKEDWGREEGRPGTDEPTSADIFFKYGSPQWYYTAGPTNTLCIPFPIGVNTLGSPPYWPCVLWPAADGTLVPTEGMPTGVWNGARVGVE